MEANLFSQALEAVNDIRSEEGTIQTKPFLDLCRHLLPLVDEFGSSLSCVKADIANNIEKLESKYDSDPSRYGDLYTITEEEVEDNSARNPTSCTYAFVWLNRTVDFLVQVLCNLIENPEWSMTQACTESYNKTLRPWHGWMVISSFKVIMKLAPERKKFLHSICMNEEGSLDITKFCIAFSPVLEENHKFLADVGVDDLRYS